MCRLGIFMLGCITGILGTFITIFNNEEESDFNNIRTMTNKYTAPHAGEETLQKW